MRKIIRLEYINGSSSFFENIDDALLYIENSNFGAATCPSIHEEMLYEKCDIQPHKNRKEEV